MSIATLNILQNFYSCLAPSNMHSQGICAIAGKQINGIAFDSATGIARCIDSIIFFHGIICEYYLDLRPERDDIRIYGDSSG